MRPIYRPRDQWVLGVCSECGRENYVEPHGTTAHCSTEGRSTEHKSIPMSSRDVSGNWRK